MKNKHIAGAGALFLALLLSLSALIVGAQGASDSGPSSAINLDNQRHSVPANSTMWFRFGYTASTTGTEPVTTLRMILGNKHGLDFDVWTPDAATNWPNSKPLAQGAPYEVNCDTGLPAAQGGCESNDLLWTGALTTTGDHYARVTNANPFNVRVYLTGSGTGVELIAPSVSVPGVNQTPVPVPVTGLGSQPSSATTVLSNRDDPAKALAIAGTQQTLAPQSGVWYRFDYTVSDTGDRPIKTIRLVNGNNRGLKLEVWSAENQNLDHWYDKHPTGRGTAYEINCDTGVIASGTGCQARDLIWVGAFGTSGTYYVRVVNDNLQPTPFLLTIE